MATATNYYVVNDTPTQLSFAIGANSKIDFPLNFNSFSAQSVLSYMVHVNPNASHMTFKMSIITGVVDDIDKVILIVPSTTVPTQSAHTRQEVIAGNVFQGINFRLRIEVTSGMGSFSDIVILHKINV